VRFPGKPHFLRAAKGLFIPRSGKIWEGLPWEKPALYFGGKYKLKEDSGLSMRSGFTTPPFIYSQVRKGAEMTEK
jgi:hypothetical protein